MHAVVIGAGIAGASVAYFLARAGARVTVVDAGVHAASSVPGALVNPVRGQSGGVDPRALTGMAFTWALLRDLAAAGFAVPHGQVGVLRPVPDDRARARFERNLPSALAHAWLAPGDAPARLSPGWAHVLHLPEGGWVDGPALTRALLAASGARVVRGRALDWSGREVHLSPAQGGLEHLQADAVVFCGGSVGVTWQAQGGRGGAGVHRMGTLLTLERPVTRVPVSFGAYLAPHGSGGVLGATFEAPAGSWAPEALPLGSLAWLLGRGEALSALGGVRVTGRWTGSRLSGLECGAEAGRGWRLTGLGSKGFLLGPLLASELAARVVGEAQA
ncbi:FAD-binding oxidoreductase [Deinococcus taeanensis]|uniref:NAD(P)/FAD-dependent oxidoreductase n=1 Tax=Deinococcus taeanensis TaxID=2737050 RepID=UPI001CDD7A9C|nr:FAD-dependent oxidoreductase [Deinococcus taeanensis]UBV41871.1 FAD-binding oxidoreductase [Deinococcus taeanensis]